MLTPLLLWPLVLASVSGDQLQDVFNSSEVVHDVLLQPPQDVLQVSFSPSLMADLGNELSVAATRGQPSILFSKADKDLLYTLAMVDPDAPSRTNPRFGQWNHWLVINIPGSVNMEGGKTLTEYMGPSPPRGSGPHRYVLLLYAQKHKVDLQVSSRRNNFNIENWTEGFGELVAGNFFYAENQ